MEVFSDVAVKIKSHTKATTNEFILHDYAKENINWSSKFISTSTCQETKLFDEEKHMAFRRTIVCISYTILMAPKLIDLCLSLEVYRSPKAIFSSINLYLRSIAHSVSLCKYYFFSLQKYSGRPGGIQP